MSYARSYLAAALLVLSCATGVAEANEIAVSELGYGRHVVKDIVHPLAPNSITHSVDPDTLVGGTSVACQTGTPTGCNCCAGGNGVGCDCSPCEDKVCNIDLFCCEIAWDAVCDSAAGSICSCCDGGPCDGGATPGCNCCNGGSPDGGCDDPACETDVCAGDSFCCDVAWDAFCDASAATLCTCCVGAPAGTPTGVFTADTGWWRLFDLDEDFALSGEYCVKDVDYGIELSVGVQDITANVYCLDDGLPFLDVFLQLAGTASQRQPATALEFFNIQVSGCCDTATQSMAVALVSEDCIASSSCQNLFIGMNDLGQTAPTYVTAPDCGVIDPLDLGSIGFPDAHLVMVVHGNDEDAGGDGGGGDGGGDGGSDGGGDGGDDGGSGPCNCCAGGDGVGCDCLPCEETVCSADVFCCDTAWDSICDGEAATMCTCCPGQNPGACGDLPGDGGGGDGGGGGAPCDCCESTGQIGCSDCLACELYVCSVDSFCCDTAWDQVCADQAASLCTCCPGQDPGFCATPPEGGGGVPASDTLAVGLSMALLLAAGTYVLLRRRRSATAR